MGTLPANGRDATGAVNPVAPGGTVVNAGTVPPPADRVVPGPGQESVWDYPRPPRVEPVPERVRVVAGGIVVADLTRALRVLETAGPPVYYVPPADVRTELLRPTGHTSVCEWKGLARYRQLRLARRSPAGTSTT